MNARATLITVILALALLVPGAANADVSWPYPAWQNFFTITDTSGNPLVGPTIRMFDDTLMGDPQFPPGQDPEFYYRGIVGARDLYTGGSGIDIFYLGFERSCIPDLYLFGAYPFNMSTSININCWVGGAFARVDGEQLRVLADASWTDAGGMTWVFDHWVLDNVKTGCAQGATSPECSFTTLGMTAYAFHALYRQAPAAPTSDAGGPYTVGEGSSIVLQGAGTGGEAPLTYEWVGATSQLNSPSSQSPTFKARDDGQFPFTLLVTDAAGLVGTDDTTVTVTNRPPLVSPIVVDQNKNRRLVLGAAFVDAGLFDTHTATVTWGDGSQSTATVKELKGIGATAATHQYAAKGTYAVTLTVQDDDGGTAQRTLNVAIK